MKVAATAISDVLLLEPTVYEDARGFFFESFNQKRFDDTVGRNVAFVQDNHSHSGGRARPLVQSQPSTQAAID